MKNILLTLDYELYGNGSGDVFKHIIEPTDRLLEIAERYGVKYTFFFEVIEYWKLKEEWARGNKMGYSENPVAAMENQIREAYRRGHDVQLHLHPQWVDAVWTESGWKVNLSQWRLGGYIGEGENSLVNLLRRGKETLEQIIDAPDYRCTALRAGGYNVQPSKELVKAMRAVGLTADTSIYPGGVCTGNLSRYDYSAIPADLGSWYCGERLEEVVGGSDIIEFPIVALPMQNYQKYLSIDRIKSLLQNRKSAKDSFDAKTGGGKNGLLGKFSYFFQTDWQTWDFCLFSKTQHGKFIRAMKKQCRREEFVLVGHPKSFISGAAFEWLLKKTHNDFQYITITEQLKTIK